MAEERSPEGFTLSDAAKATGLSRIALRNRVLRGTISATKSEDGAWIIPTEEIDRLNNENRDSSSPVPPPVSSPVSPPVEEQVIFNAMPPMMRQSIDEDEHLGDLLDAVTADRDFLRDQLKAITEHYAAQAERADQERAELRRLLGNAQMQLAALLPASASSLSVDNDEDDQDALMQEVKRRQDAEHERDQLRDQMAVMSSQASATDHTEAPHSDDGMTNGKAKSSGGFMGWLERFFGQSS